MKSFSNETLFFSILVKRIIIFVAYLDTMKQRLKEWETWQKESYFPDNMINTAYHFTSLKVYKLKR